MKDIARKAGVSVNAVSLALRSSPEVSKSTRERIQGLAREMGYQRNPATSELMRQMRLRGHHQRGATFAVVNGHEDRHAFTRHPTIPAYLRGIERRAEAGGYGLDRFWMHQEDLRYERWRTIFEHRNIRGLLIVGLMRTNRLPEVFQRICQSYPCVVTGVRTESPALSFSSVDHHAVTLLAVREVLASGYRRPGLVLDQELDDLVMGRFSSGYRLGQEALPVRQRLPVYNRHETADEPPESFRGWMTKHRPDVILTLFNRTRRWVEALRLPQPGWVQLELRPGQEDWAGMNQHNDLVGESAFDMLVSALLNGETGVPPFAKGMMISPTWRDGASLPDARRGS
ncbi:MAG: LacI family DNA-binding transcriptional regulator [Verrucomicrobia bacterium]|nr:LacI family DNA-binding transcriptional regulator [Verrucomicrobiota bacterium]